MGSPKFSINEAIFKLHPGGVSQLAQSAMMRHAMSTLAADLAASAQANGSVFTKDYTSKTEQEGGETVAYAYTDYPFAHWDEWGNVRRAPVAPMRRAIHSAGLWRSFKENPK